MNVKMQHLFRVTNALLVLIVLLSGPVSSATAQEARQEPTGWIVQGYGDFPRLPVAAPGADGSTLALYLIAGDRATQLLEFEGLHIGDDSVIVQPSPDGEHIAALLNCDR